ncbi:hypothetical protein D3C87_1597720 [compost metagenome]
MGAKSFKLSRPAELDIFSGADDKHPRLGFSPKQLTNHTQRLHGFTQTDFVGQVGDALAL